MRATAPLMVSPSCARPSRARVAAWRSLWAATGLLAVCAHAASLYVDAAALAEGNGTRRAPFRTISAAAAVAQPGDVCLIAGGTYRETVTPHASGVAGRPITFQPADPRLPVIVSGSDPLPTAGWRQIDEHRWELHVQLPLADENEIFLGEPMLHEARWPNVGADLLVPTLATMEDGTSPTRIVDPHLPAGDWTGASVWVHAEPAWSDWTTAVASASPGILQIDNRAPFPGPRAHVARPGATYFIFGTAAALDAPDEWYYDARSAGLQVWCPTGTTPPRGLEAKMRRVGFDLRGKRHVIIDGLTLRACTITTDPGTAFVTLKNSRLLFPSNSDVADFPAHRLQSDSGLVLLGSHLDVTGCEIAYSSGCGLVLAGEQNRVFNSYVHDCDWIGTFASCVRLAGKGNVLSNCTLARCGRAALDYSGMYQALVQYCDLRDSGLLTSDTGLTYGISTEGGNSEVRFNWLHDNHAQSHVMGLYYDHGTQNVISDHNLITGAVDSGITLNHYAYYDIVCDNVVVARRLGIQSQWGNQYGFDLFGCRFERNIATAPYVIFGGNYAWIDNVVTTAADLAARRDRDPAGADPVRQVMETKFGYDWQHVPHVSFDRWLPPQRNLLENPAFEHEDHVRPWRVVSGQVAVEHGVKTQTTPDRATMRIGHFSLKLEPGTDLSQDVTGLRPGSWYEFAGWVRADDASRAELGVIFPDGSSRWSASLTTTARSLYSTYWERAVVRFKTGPQCDHVRVSVRRAAQGDGDLTIDDFGLQLLDEP